MGALTNSIPGFGGLNNQASQLIKELMSGTLSTGVKNSIYDAGAERATLGGMPGSTGMGGSLFANNDLRNIGRTADDQQQRGFQDLLSLIGNYSGTVAPTPGQEIQQQQFNKEFNQRRADNAYNRYASEQQSQPKIPAKKLFKYFGPSVGSGGLSSSTSYREFWM